MKGVYNRYQYFEEKSDALARLATLIERIVNPPSGNVVPCGDTKSAVQS